MALAGSGSRRTKAARKTAAKGSYSTGGPNVRSRNLQGRLAWARATIRKADAFAAKGSEACHNAGMTMKNLIYQFERRIEPFDKPLTTRKQAQILKSVKAAAARLKKKCWY